MALFAQIDDGIVTNVIVADQEFIDTLTGTWVETFENPTPETGYNMAMIGGRYDAEAKAFIQTRGVGRTKWVLNTETYQWEPPVPIPQPEWWTSLTNEEKAAVDPIKKATVLQYRWNDVTGEWDETGYNMSQLRWS